MIATDYDTDIYAPLAPEFRSSILGTLSVVSAVGGSVITTAESKAQCKVEVADDDTYIDTLIASATAFCERMIDGHRQFLTTTYDVLVSDWWECIRLPRPPLLSVSHVKYYDTDGTQQTLATTYYNVFTPWRQQGRIERAPDQTWPSYQSDRAYPITVRFVAGYLSPITAVVATDVITSAGLAFNDTQRVRLWNVGGALPAGLSTGTDYYVRDASAQTFKVTTTPSTGSAVDITDTGTGLHYAGEFPDTIKMAIKHVVAHWYRNREAVLTGTISKEIEIGVRALLESEGYGSYA